MLEIKRIKTGGTLIANPKKIRFPDVVFVNTKIIARVSAFAIRVKREAFAGC